MTKKDVTNLFSLAGIQGANAMFPLVIFPYLYLQLGSDKFSIVAVTEAAILFVLAVCMYSYDVSGVKSVVNLCTSEDRIEESRYYWSILLIRLALLSVELFLVLLVTALFFKDYLPSMILWFMLPIGMILQSNYYFQACEENLPLCIFVLVSRIFSCFMIYFIIDGPEDYLLSIFFLAGSYVLSGLMSATYVWSKKSLAFRVVPIKLAWLSVRDEVAIVIGNLSVALFRGSNILVLSSVSTPDAVAMYTLSEKTVKSIQAIARPLNQLAFPKLVRDLEGKSDWIAIRPCIWLRTWRQLSVLAVLVPLIVVALYFLSNIELWRAFEGEVLLLVVVMSLAIFFGIPNYMFGTVGLNMLGYSRFYANSIAIAGVVTLTVSVVMCSLFAEYGGGGSFVFGECLLFGIVYYKYCERKGVQN